MAADAGCAGVGRNRTGSKLGTRSKSSFPAQPGGLQSAKADDGVRTRDPQLGKLMLYQLSYVRVAVILPLFRAFPARARGAI
jgi:hypothetical protein